MTGSRAKLLRKPELARLGVDLEEHLENWIKSSSAADLFRVFDEGCMALLREAFLKIGGCEGTVWLVDEEELNLVAVYNSGNDASTLVGFEQPVGSGIISMVFAQQQPYCENNIGNSHGHDDTLDKKISKHTTAMIAVPFYFARGIRGVVSCVQLQEIDTANAKQGFSSNDVTELAKVVNLAERLITETLQSIALGINDAG
jgi:transcriptional regulator with GAF, ATPase, and Fis domain